MNEFRGIFVKENYNLVALVSDGCGGGAYHAIIHRSKTNDFVFCHYYNVNNGTWGQGDYFTTYSDALNRMLEYLGGKI